jgi:peptidyl-prolyl cis-trans isomerase D
MLQFIRSKASSWFIKVLFFALIAAFGLWGINDVFRGQPGDPVVAKVGSTKITLGEYRSEYQRQLKRMAGALGPQFTDELAKQMGLPQQVLNQMVGRALFTSLGTSLGLRAPDDVLRHALETTPAFLNEAGQFDRQRFSRALDSAGMNETAYLAGLGGQFVANEIYESIGASATAPMAMVDAIYDYRAEKRVADTLLIADASVANISAPDLASLVKFHKDHADRYQAPEYRKLTIARIRISDDQIAKEYAAHPERYAAFGKRQFLTFTLPDEATAKKAASEIAAGGDFAAVAKKATGADPIDTGMIDKAQMLPEMAGPAYAATAGSVVGPVRTALGWQIVKVVKAEPNRPRALDEVRNEIARALAQGESAGDLVNVANQLDDTLAGGASLEDAARKLGLQIETIPAVSRDGLDASGKPIGELIGTPQLLSTAFSTDVDQLSSQLPDGAGGYFIVRVDQVTPASLRPLDQVKDKVLADWQAEARDKAAADQATKIVDRIKMGEDLKTIAQSRGVALKYSSAFTRDAGDEANDVPPSLASLLFTVKRGQAATAPNDSAANPGHVVAVVAEILPANPATDAEGVKKLADELSQTLDQDLLSQFRKALESQIAVTIEPKAAEASN